MPFSIFDRPDFADILANRHLATKLVPDHVYPNVFLAPCTIKILMVTDSGGGFGDQEFSLSELIKVLTENMGPYARPVITRAHRQQGEESDLQGFRFDKDDDNFDLSDFDQIWLFGVSTSLNPLNDNELEALAEFMDSGGGVFATGDHENLGAAMCGSIPRVRSMRKWHYPRPGPNGEPVAPPGTGPDRHDTLVRSNNDDIVFDNQSDDIAQRIDPKMYRQRRLFWSYEYPHPVLCGRNGLIMHMPDHAHEGECYETKDLGRTFTFNGKNFVEYPRNNGFRPKPEVISYSNQGCRRKGDSKGDLNPKAFGGIAVYDGHQVNIGRVLVDATWHHFFNVNLTGADGAPPPFDNGLKESTVYEEIKDYFVNIAIYLAPVQCQRRMRFLAAFWIRWKPIITVELKPAVIIKPKTISIIHECYRIGQIARDLYGRFASRCQTRIWAFSWVTDFMTPQISSSISLFDIRRNTKIMHDYEEDLEVVIHGALIYAIAERFPKPLSKRDLARINIDAEIKAIGERTRKIVAQINKEFDREMIRGRRQVKKAMRMFD